MLFKQGKEGGGRKSNTGEKKLFHKKNGGEKTGGAMGRKVAMVKVESGLKKKNLEYKVF